MIHIFCHIAKVFAGVYRRIAGTCSYLPDHILLLAVLVGSTTISISRSICDALSGFSTLQSRLLWLEILRVRGGIARQIIRLLTADGGLSAHDRLTVLALLLYLWASIQSFVRRCLVHDRLPAYHLISWVMLTSLASKVVGTATPLSQHWWHILHTRSVVKLELFGPQYSRLSLLYARPTKATLHIFVLIWRCRRLFALIHVSKGALPHQTLLLWVLLARSVIALHLRGNKTEVPVLARGFLSRHHFELGNIVDHFGHGLNFLLADVWLFGHSLGFKGNRDVLMICDCSNCSILVTSDGILHGVDSQEVAQLIVWLDFEGI